MTIDSLTASVKTLSENVGILAQTVTAQGIDQAQQKAQGHVLRKVVLGMFVFGFVVSVVSVGSLLSFGHLCGVANDTRTGTRSVVAYFHEQTLRSPTLTPERRQATEELFTHAERLIPPVDCGPKAIAVHVGKGLVIAGTASVFLALLGFVAFPCGRRFLARRWSRTRGAT